MLHKGRIFVCLLIHSQHYLALGRYSFNVYCVNKELLDFGGVLVKYKPFSLNYVTHYTSSSSLLVMALFSQLQERPVNDGTLNYLHLRTQASLGHLH